MKLGLITDIHEQVELLRIALDHFRQEQVDRVIVIGIFNAKPHRLMFAGHYHNWLLVTPDGIADWEGECPIRLDGGRYFVVVGGLLEGRYAILDTETSQLVPFEY